MAKDAHLPFCCVLRDVGTSLFLVRPDSHTGWVVDESRVSPLSQDRRYGKEDRLLLSGTVLRKTLSEGGEVPSDFSRPEVLTILQNYYQKLENKVEVKLHRGATGEA
jgi:hypothetical protein